MTWSVELLEQRNDMVYPDVQNTLRNSNYVVKCCRIGSCNGISLAVLLLNIIDQYLWMLIDA